LANIKADATLLDMVSIPEQQKHLKDFMEGKTSTVANLSEEVDEEDSTVNKVGVNNFRDSVKNPPFFISINIIDKLAHCCLIDDGSGPSAMLKIIMEELGLSCTHPHIPDNVESWQVFPSDESICAFIQNEPYKPNEIICMEDNKIPKGLTPLESSFALSDVGDKEKHKEEESKRKLGETISLNIGTPDCAKNVKIGAQCSDEEKMKFTELLREFQDVFSWSYEDFRGFDPALIQHAIPIKEGIKPVRQKQRPINPSLEATIRKELGKLLKAGIIFPVKYSEWVSNLVPVQKTTGQI
jgi:hypothetical protein